VRDETRKILRAFKPVGAQEWCAQYRAGAEAFLPNVICVGGSWMVKPWQLRARDWPAIEALARAASRLSSS
jgi:2-keto-3-deoxy-6-phosphogluconate aldolase